MVADGAPWSDPLHAPWEEMIHIAGMMGINEGKAEDTLVCAVAPIPVESC